MSPVRILLAESDPAHQDLLVLALTDGRPDTQVLIVRNGFECLSLLRASPRATFDCIVLNYDLSDCRADLLLRLIAQNHAECPTVVVSSSTDQQVVLDSIRNGCLDFVPKDRALRGDELRKCVYRAIAKWGAARQERRKLVRRAQRLAHLAETDPLTGLGNRLSLDRLLTGRRRAIERRGGAICVMMDVDHFKAVNDRYGHPCGDMVLASMGRHILAGLRPGDAGFRIGGEEFLIVLTGTGPANALLWAERFRCEVQSSPIQFGSSLVPVSISIGVGSLLPGPISSETLAEVDRALYMAKDLGRNRVCTVQMLEIEQMLAHLSRQNHWSIEQRLSRLLWARRETLGPTQREHLTVHSCLVANKAVQLGRRLGVSGLTVGHLWLAGIAHDLGKLLLPEDILAQPRPLSTAEKALVAHHGEEGARMAGRLGVDEAVARFIRRHHVPYDTHDASPASGATLQGEHILAVADAWVAMKSPRAYRPSLSDADAVHELQHEKGRRFHPGAVDLLLADKRTTDGLSVAGSEGLSVGGNEDVYGSSPQSPRRP